jgi:hypothetical protein
MANPEHVAILKQGVESWNEWREKNLGIIPDLSGADFSGASLESTNLTLANLDGAKLSEANLFRADLRIAKLNGADLSGSNLLEASLRLAKLEGADLSGSNLEGASLRFAKLEGADLSGSNLEGAELIFTNLEGASLIKANLERANLGEANLFGTDFKFAIFFATAFNNVDLSTVKGLDTVEHVGPSTIGIDTLYKSKGNIPEVFLRGCGVPDQMIEYAKSLTANPIEYYSCFISYSHMDDEFVKRVHNDLQAAGVRCWFAPHDMKIGDQIRPAIEEKIRLHEKLLLIFSKDSVESNWVKHEVKEALDLEIDRGKPVLFPVRVDDFVMESNADWVANIKKKRHIGDFTRWKDHDAYQAAFTLLLRDLTAV